MIASAISAHFWIKLNNSTKLLFMMIKFIMYMSKKQPKTRNNSQILILIVYNFRNNKELWLLTLLILTTNNVKKARNWLVLEI
jgi:hypothetical protein